MVTTVNKRQVIIDELNRNREIAEIPAEKMAEDLGTSEEYLESVFELNLNMYEDVWILRNYLNSKIEEQGKSAHPYRGLAGEVEDYWYLNRDFVKQGQMSAY